MQINQQYTKEPVKGFVKPLIFGKKVVDLDGAMLCFLRNGKLYDLNHVCFASCERVDPEKNGEIDAFSTDGKYLYDKGIKVGIIKDRFFLLILILLILLLISIISLLVFVKGRHDPIVPEFTVVDTNGEWGMTSEINVFGNRTIKPGDKGNYMFMITNPNAADIECTIKFTINYENSATLPPIIYTVTSEGKTFETSEIETENENGFMTAGVIINKKGSRSIILEWDWKFDGDDTIDTNVGIIGGKYTITIEISAEEAATPAKR